MNTEHIGKTPDNIYQTPNRYLYRAFRRPFHCSAVIPPVVLKYICSFIMTLPTLRSLQEIYGCDTELLVGVMRYKLNMDYRETGVLKWKYK